MNSMKEDKGLNSSERSFRVVWPLLFSQTIGAFNDNAMKAMIPLIAAVQLGKGSMDEVSTRVSVLLIVPFVIFAPIAGWITDRFSKKKVIHYSLLAQLFGLGIIVYSFTEESLTLCLSGFFLLSVQSAFLSPAKKGILKELVGTNRLAKAVGFMEMLAMLGILGGAFVGAIAFDLIVQERGGWEAAKVICFFTSLLAILSWMVSLLIPDTNVRSVRSFNYKLLITHFQDLFYLFKRRGLRYAAMGDAWFWAMGGFLYLVFVKLSGEVVSGKVGMGTLYGSWFLLLGIGIMVGSIFVAYLNRGRIEIGLSAIGAIGIPFVYIGMYFTDPLFEAFEFCCLALGFFGALFFVPLNGYLQDQAGEHERGRIIAASNLLTQLSGIFLIVLHSFFSNVLALTSKQELLIILFASSIIGFFTLRSLLEDFFRALFHVFLRIFYRIKIFGMENFPMSGGCLLVSNHLSYADPVFIGAAFPRKIRYLAYTGLAKSRIMRLVFKLTETLTVSQERSLASIKKSVRKLNSGVPLCVFAEGGISRLGTLLPFMRGSILLAKQANVPIVPVHLDGVWGSIFSMKGGKFFKKKPESFPYEITVRVGQPINPKVSSTAEVRSQVMELGRLSFNSRLKEGKDALDYLKYKIFRNTEVEIIESNDGQIWEKSDLLKMLKKPKDQIPRQFQLWVQELENLIKGDLSLADKIYSNWTRVTEMNLWDENAFLIGQGKGPWVNSWIPWFPLLGDRKMRFMPDGIMLHKEGLNTPEKEIILVEGLASSKNGLIAINGPDSSSDPTEDSVSKQSGSKPNTFGKLLNGYSYSVSEHEFFLRGRGLPEKIEIVRKIDQDGFLVPA